MKKNYVSNGTVQLIAGGGKIYTDIAARFVRSEKPICEIIDSEYNAQIVKNILESKHYAALEFDYFIFGVEGYSRVCETQLVRKRLASYLIKSGRTELNGKREFSIVAPKKIYTAVAGVDLYYNGEKITLSLSGEDICSIIEQWYNTLIKTRQYKEEDLRYIKPQATEFKAIIGMNAHALRDWFKIRCCMNAQTEIRDLATKMLKCCKEVAPDLFEGAGASCVELGYCPEGRLQHESCKRAGLIYTKDEALSILQKQKAIDNHNRN